LHLATNGFFLKDPKRDLNDGCEGFDLINSEGSELNRLTG
jgi:hypothetical protein